MFSTAAQIRTSIESAFPAPIPRRDAAGNKNKAPRPVSSPAQVYARKLRRLLLATLDMPTSEWKPRSVALWELSHESGYVFCHPNSPTTKRLEKERASLANDQYRAVVSFLQWVADGPLPLADRHRAVLALQWVWTRFGVDRARLDAFYEPFVNYQRPPIADPTSEELACQIEAAFAKTPEPTEIASDASDESCDIAVTFERICVGRG